MSPLTDIAHLPIITFVLIELQGIPHHAELLILLSIFSDNLNEISITILEEVRLLYIS